MSTRNAPCIFHAEARRTRGNVCNSLNPMALDFIAPSKSDSTSDRTFSGPNL